MHRVAVLLVPGIALVATACAVPPPAGPSVMALPGQGKNFEAFQQDDVACRQYAWQQTGGAAPGAAASQSAVGSAVVGTALGAAAGAAIGAASGAAGAGAAIGAGAGLLAGSAVGANNAAATYGGVQQLYDISYTQCMTAQGNSVQAPPTYAAYPYPSYPLSQLSHIPIRTPIRIRAITDRRCSRHQSPSALAADGVGAEAGVAAEVGAAGAGAGAVGWHH